MSREASVEHLKRQVIILEQQVILLEQQVSILDNQLDAARAQLSGLPVHFPPLASTERLKASSDCLGSGLDFQEADSEDGSMKFP